MLGVAAIGGQVLQGHHGNLPIIALVLFVAVPGAFWILSRLSQAAAEHRPEHPDPPDDPRSEHVSKP